MYTCLSACLPVCLHAHMSVCTSTSLSAYLPVSLRPGPCDCRASRSGSGPCEPLQSDTESGSGLLNLSVLQVRSALLAEVEEARRSWELERCRLQQEVQELRGAKRTTEEALTSAQQACQARAAELRSAHHQHQEEQNRTKRDCEREIRRLVRVSNTHELHLLVFVQISSEALKPWPVFTNPLKLKEAPVWPETTKRLCRPHSGVSVRTEGSPQSF